MQEKRNADAIIATMPANNSKANGPSSSSPAQTQTGELNTVKSYNLRKDNDKTKANTSESQSNSSVSYYDTVGIDLGTTKVVVAVMRSDDSVEIVPPTSVH